MVIYKKLFVYFVWYLAEFFLKQAMLHRNFAEEIKTHILLNKSFSENQTVYEIMCEKYGRSAQATDGSTVRRVSVYGG